MQIIDVIKQRVVDLYDRTSLRFPEQWLPGNIKYQDRLYAFPYIKDLKLTTDSGANFAVAVEEARATMKMNQDTPIYLTKITASLSSMENYEIIAPDRARQYRPLASNRGFFGTTRPPNFKWQCYLGDEESKITSEWSPSMLLNGQDEVGYKLDSVLEIKRGQTLTVKALPIEIMTHASDYYLPELHFQLHFIKYFADVKQVLQAYNQLDPLLSKKIRFPERWLPGDVKYQNKYPFPQIKNLLLTQDDGLSFARTSSESKVTYRFNEDKPTYLSRVSASIILREPDRTLYAPLAHDHTNMLFFDIAVPLDFEWKMTVEDESLKITDEWLPSTLLNDWFERGYKLPCLVELKRGSNIQIQARPLNVYGDLAIEYDPQLEFQLHTIKYFDSTEKVQQAMSNGR